MKRRKTLGSDSMNQQQLWPSGTRSRAAATISSCCSNNSSIATQSSSSSGSNTMYAYKTDFTIFQTIPQSSSHKKITLEQRKGKCHTKNIRYSNHGPRGQRANHLTCYPTIFIVYIDRDWYVSCLLYTSPSPRDKRQSRMPSSA